MVAPTNGVIDVWAQPGFPALIHMPEMESLRRGAPPAPCFRRSRDARYPTSMRWP